MRRIIKKRAGIYGDIAGNIVTGPLTGGLANAVGAVHGLLTADDETDATLAQANRNGALSIIPGVGASRIVRKMLHSAQKGKNPGVNVAGEYFGPLTSMLTAAGIGAGVGAGAGGLIGGSGRAAGIGALAGAGAGAGIAGLAGLASMIAAGIVRRRTNAEQAAHDASANVSNFLVPGVANYNLYKRRGNIHGNEVEQDIKDARKGII